MNKNMFEIFRTAFSKVKYYRLNSIVQVMHNLSPNERWQELEQGSGPWRKLRWNVCLRNIITVEIIDFLKYF